ncbi:alpha/beta hydrolase-fold protein [Streptomyces sp. NPDC056480]|uniref:alpha/beta hydrolase-fold protein n=1 Tax=Streptomyces sp. NPDC056480 TaxID=3345833 RepID=UPI0036C8075A
MLTLAGWVSPVPAEPEPFRIYAHYDTGWGNALSIRGSSASLNWNAGRQMKWTDGNVWTWEVPSSSHSFEFKVLFNDTAWSIGGNYIVNARTSRSIHIYPFFGESRGSRVTISGFHSPQLGNRRDVTMYLPPSYRENGAKRYPVVYMHDGQNLFDSRTAFGGVEWQVDEALDRLTSLGVTREAIVVGINNTASRIDEYTPTVDPEYGGGDANTYLDFVQHTLKPYVDARYRTLTGAPDTLMAGSSLGGLLSCYAGWTRSTVYGAVGCMSSSFWWDSESFTHTVETSVGRRSERFYVDAGGNRDGAAQTGRFRDALLARGYINGDSLLSVDDPLGSHNESSWARRLPGALAYLLPFQAEIRTK